MNKGLPGNDPTYRFYDGDYPSLLLGPLCGHEPDLARRHMIDGDVERYAAVAGQTGDPLLEIGCGTGRLTIPLARMGHVLTAVDVAPAMLARLQRRVAREPEAVQARINPVEQDAVRLDLSHRDHALAFIPFNTLMLIDDLEAQCRTLQRAAAHLRPGGWLALDVLNPLVLPLDANETPDMPVPRVHPETGNRYRRFALNSRLDDRQRQRIHGWYEETLPTGRVVRNDYAFWWRPVFRYELELMVRAAGLTVEAVEDGFSGNAWTVDSPKLFLVAYKPKE